jgi:hypothetical protein
MAGHAERKQRALARVHRTFERPAVHLPHTAGQPVAVNIRLHEKPTIESKQEDDWSNAAAYSEMADRIVFDAAEVQSIRLKSYTFYKAPGRELQVFISGPSEPMREGFIRVEVTPLSASEIEALLDTLDLSAPIWETLGL